MTLFELSEEGQNWLRGWHKGTQKDINKPSYVIYKSAYNQIHGYVKASKNDKYRDVIWEKGTTPKKSRIKQDRYHLYEWIYF